MHGPRALVAAAALLAAGCSGGVVSIHAAPVPTTAARTAALPADVPAPGTIEGPVPIPADPYAPEPVKRIGTMEIPKIGLTHAIYEGVTLNNIDHGPSHWPGSALPGQPGNAVFAGHRSTHDHPFRRIGELVAGDLVVFTVNGVRSTYRVTGDLVVAPADTWIADPTPGPTATLYACHPPGSVTSRYVVRLELAA